MARVHKCCDKKEKTRKRELIRKGSETKNDLKQKKKRRN